MITDIYVDGSFKNSKYAWAFVAYQNGEEIYSTYGVGMNDDAVSMRNVAGELSAAMRGVNWAIKERLGKIVIHHDYTGIAAWVTGAWKAKKGMTQKYAAFMRPHYLNGLVQFQQVTGHSGNKGNDRADKLARNAFDLEDGA
ncbi:MAG TPA: RNase H family protein [Clostridia bacterium]|nr:RNase H family protein [Clostridia bacterium]